MQYKRDYFSFAITKISTSDKYKIFVLPINSTEGYSLECVWKDVVQHYRSWISGLANEVKTPTG